jgi:hypothetical protein
VDHAWLASEPVLCLTYVRDLEAVRVLTELGAPLGLTARGSVIETDPDQPRVYVGSPVPSNWQVMVEPSSMVSHEDVTLERLSADDREAVSLLRTMTIDTFKYARAGKLLVSFEPMSPADRYGADPDVLLPQMTGAGLMDPGDRWPTGLALTMIGTTFGVPIDFESLYRTPLLSAPLDPDAYPGLVFA